MNQPSAIPNPTPTTLIDPIGAVAPESTLARIIAPLLETPSRVGCAIHIMSKGRLARRGLVIDETPGTYIVQWIDVFGMPAETRTIAKSKTKSWKWFVDVPHSNVVYDRMFNQQAK